MVDKEQVNHLCINKEELEEKLSQITEWQEWYDLEKSLFKLGEWKEADIETLEAREQRETIVLDGHEWMPIVDLYDDNREMIYLHEIASYYVFEKLEPEANAENLSRKEEYGKQCRFCLRYTIDFEVENCPFCGRKLTPVYLENWEE